MKYRVLMMTALLATPAAADIYKCKDAEGRISYQNMPCAGATLGRVKEAPPVSLEAQKQAQENLQRLQEINRQHDIEREKAWQKEQEEARRIAEAEERARQQAERERLEQERRERYYWYPWLPRWPWFNRPPPPHHPPHSGAPHRPREQKCRPLPDGGTRCD